MQIQCVSVCETGKVRKINQDAVFSSFTENWGLFVVADGMGGHSDGERASREVVAAIEEWLGGEAHLEKLSTSDLILELKEVLSAANDKIFRDTPSGIKCGCTVVALAIIRDVAILITAGDSRCYEWKKGTFRSELRQLTTDDVVGGNGPKRNRLTNAVGIHAPLTCRVNILPRKGSHLFMLCSDGLYKYCRTADIKESLKWANGKNLPEVLDDLQYFVEESGARDNYSIILVQVKD